MSTLLKATLLLTLALSFLAARMHAAEPAWDALRSYNVVWDSPSADSTGSMPLGNGDLGLNVWVEKNGDLVFYIGKTDAWGLQPDENNPARTQMSLLKVGRVRISLSPAPALEVFRQELDLQTAVIRITMGTKAAPIQLRVWVDANHPVIHVQADAAQPVSLKVAAELWRLDPAKEANVDRLVTGQKDRVTWYFERPDDKVNKEITGATFGAALRGEGLVNRDDQTLVSAAPRPSWHVEAHVLTAPGAAPESWQTQLAQQIAEAAKIPAATAQREHLAWWNAFWNRSWIYAEGQDARAVTEGYILQRFITACAGRGAFPIKFNGSIFVSDYPRRFPTGGKTIEEPVNADYRRWGGSYWFQNTRLIYWPLLASGDFDFMKPFFGMYQTILERNEARVRNFYSHAGSVFAEYGGYWGYVGKVLAEDPGSHVKHYYFPVLELTAVGLDYYDYTQDAKFLRETLLPIATLGVAFYDEHFTRDEQGKLLLSPVNALETYWKAKKPMPDLAALRFVLPRLLRLPAGAIPEAERKRWQRLLGEVPELPTATVEGKTLLRPAQEIGEIKNSENAELYAVFPFRIFGVGKPNLELARDTFAARRVKNAYGWHPDAMLAALLGDAQFAREYTLSMFKNKDEVLRFPAFWGQPNTHDYWPDQDNGANGVQALQQMLVQADDGKIQLLPAWPKDWNVRFKLHAPGNTVIEGSFIKGKLGPVAITPASRRKEVVTILGVPGQLP